MKKGLGFLALLVAVIVGFRLFTTKPNALPPRHPEATRPRRGEEEGVAKTAWTRFAERAARRAQRVRRNSRSADLRALLRGEGEIRLTAPQVPAGMRLLGDDLTPEARFRLAQAINRAVAPGDARRYLPFLRAALERPGGLHAFLGRREIQEEVADLFLEDPDTDVRAGAAFLLQEIPQGLSVKVWEEARKNVRSAPPRLRIESMELLAALPLSRADAELIASLPPEATGEVKIAAARALAAGKADRDLLRPVLESIAGDPALSPEARRAAEEALMQIKE